MEKKKSSTSQKAKNSHTATVARSAGMSPLTIGKSVFIRTVTHYHTGRIVAINDLEIVLSDAAWIADTGRMAQALREGVLSEVEPFPDGNVSINRGSMIDCCEWRFALPRSTK